MKVPLCVTNVKHLESFGTLYPLPFGVCDPKTKRPKVIERIMDAKRS